ncbi:MAG: hypothetical protein LUE17_05355 [Planctomycetaceae bacterium]|nr:hypothetical protein [Planctomycetaceae bacterium]
MKANISKRTEECPTVARHVAFWEDAIFSDSISHLWDRIEAFSEEFCRVFCIGCRNERPCGGELWHRKNDIHRAMEYFPVEIYDQFLRITAGNCPACAIASSFMQFPIVAEYSKFKPLQTDSLPCRLDLSPLDSLMALDLSHPYLRSIDPGYKKTIRERFEPGQSIVRTVAELLALHCGWDRKMESPPSSASLATATSQLLAHQNTSSNSSAKVAAAGGDGGEGGDSESVASVSIKKDVAIEKDAIKQVSKQEVTVNPPDIASTLDISGRQLLEAVKLGRELAGERPSPAPAPVPSNGEIVPPEGGVTTRGIIARKLNRTPATLRGWEKSGVAPGGIPWPSGDREGTTVFYRVAEVWPSLLKMMSDRDKAKDQQLLWEIMQIKEGEDDSDEDD